MDRIETRNSRALGVRFPLLVLAGLSLLAALWGGLVRLGWNLPLPTQSLPASHGPLMVVGFLATLIGLERAVALKRRWSYLAPVFTGASGLALLAGLPMHLVLILAATGGFSLIIIFVFLYCRQPSGFMGTMGLGAFLWFVGNLLWLVGYTLHEVVPWWIGFLVLTIAGERLELSRLVRLSMLSRVGFFSANGLFLLGLGLSLFAFVAGIRLGGIGLVALALWLLRYDIARRTVGQAGLPCFMAVCLLAGYIWLGTGGLLWVLIGDSFIGGPHYDAMVHSIFLGFVFSMIFAHAPIIFPSITGLPMPFQKAFYSHFVLLHFSLLLRVGGDLVMWVPAQRWGGLLNVLAILLFLANNVRAVRLGHSEALATRSDSVA